MYGTMYSNLIKPKFVKLFTVIFVHIYKNINYKNLGFNDLNLYNSNSVNYKYDSFILPI